MVTQDEARLIAEYERLRDRLFEVEAIATAIDQRLVEIEQKLPERYVHPDDRKKPRRKQGHSGG